MITFSILIQFEKDNNNQQMNRALSAIFLHYKN